MIARGRRSSTLVVKTGGGHIELVRRGVVSLGGMIIGSLLLLLVVSARRRIVGSHSGGIVGKSGRDGSAVHVAVAAFGRDTGSLGKVGGQVARVAFLKGTLLGWYYRSRSRATTWFVIVRRIVHHYSHVAIGRGFKPLPRPVIVAMIRIMNSRMTGLYRIRWRIPSTRFGSCVARNGCRHIVALQLVDDAGHSAQYVATTDTTSLEMIHL
jgi:hypothetical protein